MKTNSITDSTSMAFGQHKGTPLGDVPASYLLYLHDIKKAGRYKEYIEEHMNQLLQEQEEAEPYEHSDGKWKN